MASIQCPHCGEKTFSWWDKYRAGKWAMLYCSHCGGRVCAQPIIMALLYFFYMWDVILFGYLAYLDSLNYLLVLLAGWLILDSFSIYVPLTALRAVEGGGAKVVGSKASPAATDDEDS